jgi:hypothetical protein
MSIVPGEVRARVQAAALIAILALSALAGLDGARRTAAQEPITILSDAAQNEFPAGVTFSVTFTAPAPAADVRLRYELAPDGTGATAIASCTGAGTITCSYPLLSGRGIFIIPGAEITYHWDIEDEQGNAISTPDALYVHQDTPAPVDGNVTVSSMPVRGPAPASHAAVETIDSVGGLEGRGVIPVKILYPPPRRMQPAIVAGAGAANAQRVVPTPPWSHRRRTLGITRHGSPLVTASHARPFGIGLDERGISISRSPLSSTRRVAIRGDRVLCAAAQLLGHRRRLIDSQPLLTRPAP